MATMARPFKCVCGAAGSDLGELHDHILDQTDGVHEPVNSEHHSDRIDRHHAKLNRREEIRTRLAEMLGVTVEELKDAFK